jgi:Domain of unknown function (DUF4149)
MRRPICAIVLLLWGAWFGGLLHLFLTVLRLFASLPRDQAGQIAGDLFHAAQQQQLIVAGATLLAIAVWYIVDKSKLKLAVFVLAAVATCATVTCTMFIVPRLEDLRRNELQHTPQFAKLHGQSMRLYMGEEGLLLIAGVMLPWAMAGGGKK